MPGELIKQNSPRSCGDRAVTDDISVYTREEKKYVKGRFGAHGGQYIPETLMNAVLELEEAYNHYKMTRNSKKELTTLLNEYAGRPSRLYYAEHMTKDLGGAKIYLKRGLKTIPAPIRSTNVLGQVLLAKKMGKTRVIAEDRRRPARCSDSDSGSALRHGMQRSTWARRTQNVRH